MILTLAKILLTLIILAAIFAAAILIVAGLYMLVYTVEYLARDNWIAKRIKTAVKEREKLGGVYGKR